MTSLKGSKCIQIVLMLRYYPSDYLQLVNNRFPSNSMLCETLRPGLPVAYHPARPVVVTMATQIYEKFFHDTVIPHLFRFFLHVKNAAPQDVTP